MWAAYHNDRTITTLEDVAHLTLQIRRCLNHACPPFRRPYRPEEEGRLALPKHEFGLDVIAWVGTLRYAQHQSLPEIYQALGDRRVAVAPRTVTNLLARYDELLALSLKDTARLQRLTVYRLPRSASSRQRWPLPRGGATIAAIHTCDTPIRHSS